MKLAYVILILGFLLTFLPMNVQAAPPVLDCSILVGEFMDSGLRAVSAEVDSQGNVIGGAWSLSGVSPTVFTISKTATNCQEIWTYSAGESHYTQAYATIYSPNGEAVSSTSLSTASRFANTNEKLQDYALGSDGNIFAWHDGVGTSGFLLRSGTSLKAFSLDGGIEWTATIQDHRVAFQEIQSPFRVMVPFENATPSPGTNLTIKLLNAQTGIVENQFDIFVSGGDLTLTFDGMYPTGLTTYVVCLRTSTGAIIAYEYDLSTLSATGDSFIFGGTPSYNNCAATPDGVIYCGSSNTIAARMQNPDETIRWTLTNPEPSSTVICKPDFNGGLWLVGIDIDTSTLAFHHYTWDETDPTPWISALVESEIVVPEFEEGFRAFMIGMGFKSIESQMLFILIIIGFGVVLASYLTSFMGEGPVKNYVVFGFSTLFGMFGVYFLILELWMASLAVVVGLSIVRGGRELRNTFSEIRTRFRPPEREQVPPGKPNADESIRRAMETVPQAPPTGQIDVGDAGTVDVGDAGMVDVGDGKPDTSSDDGDS